VSVYMNLDVHSHAAAEINCTHTVFTKELLLIGGGGVGIFFFYRTVCT
jgi:hypothetical protein